MENFLLINFNIFWQLKYFLIFIKNNRRSRLFAIKNIRKFKRFVCTTKKSHFTVVELNFFHCQFWGFLMTIKSVQKLTTGRNTGSPFRSSWRFVTNCLQRTTPVNRDSPTRRGNNRLSTAIGRQFGSDENRLELVSDVFS